MPDADIAYAVDAGLRIDRLTPGCGAEIHGVDLREEMDDVVRDSVYQALVDHGVVFFRDQDITTEQHLAFSRRFGELEVHPFAPQKDGYPEVLVLHNDENTKRGQNRWHSDVTWRLEPSLGSVLRAIQVPEVGGDTLWANMEAAYDGLSDETKETIDELVAIHDFNHFRKRLIKRGATAEEVEDFNRKYPKAEHPVVRTHPDSGRKSLYVNAAFTIGIRDMDDNEARPLLRRLFHTANRPEYQCRFRWRPNSIAFWDNRQTQHYAAFDYWPQTRIMERVTIVGDAPF